MGIHLDLLHHFPVISQEDLVSGEDMLLRLIP
jgi:hypothetical protein